MELTPGTFLGNNRYSVLRHIASGGFGCTYEAFETVTGNRVAIKEFFVRDFCTRDAATSQVSVITSGGSQLVDKLKRKFMDEASQLSAMDHGNIVKVYNVFEDNGTAYYTMRYINGPSLDTLIKKNGPLPSETVRIYMGQIAQALKYVHARGRLHLDIKPANIMIEGDKAILIDFGASKQFEAAGGHTTSTTGAYTSGYAPLEQMNNDVHRYTEATDVYAFGATLYKLLTGLTPPSASDVLNYGLTALPDNIDSTLRDIVKGCMQPRMTDRYPDMQAVIDAMQQPGATRPPESIADDSDNNDETVEAGETGDADEIAVIGSEPADTPESEAAVKPGSLAAELPFGGVLAAGPGKSPGKMVDAATAPLPMSKTPLVLFWIFAGLAIPTFMVLAIPAAIIRHRYRLFGKRRNMTLGADKIQADMTANHGNPIISKDGRYGVFSVTYRKIIAKPIYDSVFFVPGGKMIGLIAGDKTTYINPQGRTVAHAAKK